MLPRLILAAVALALVGAAPAAADSIAYIQGNDIWLATPDGARKQQVTHTGGYFYVSQADDGTLAALVGGEKIQKLSRTGQVLAEFSTYVSDGSPVGGPVTQFHGPFDPEISPDGSKIAFEYFNDTYDADPGCNELTIPSCYVYTQSQGVGITNSTGFTGFEAYGLLTGWVAPHWVSNDLLLRSSPGANLNDDAVFTQVGTTTNDRWFYDPNQGLGVEDVELSRDLQTVVGIAGFNQREAARLPHDDVAVRRARLGPHAVHEPRERAGRPAVLRAARHEVRQHHARPERHARWPTARPRGSTSLRSRPAARPATPARSSSRAPSTPTGASPTSRPRPRSSRPHRCSLRRSRAPRGSSACR